MQTASANYVSITATGLVVAQGETETGRTIQLDIFGENLDLLRRAFRLADQGIPLGHAFWHARNDVPAPCASCGEKAMNDAAKELLEALRGLLPDCEAEAIRKGYRPGDFDNIRAARAAIQHAEAAQ